MRLLIGGSPCTHWSIAQKNNRETTAEGVGWELFLNYRIARDKFQPDYFLYENNKSMSPAIRAQITAELGVEPVLINSALVSAQNRQRLYWVGKRSPDGTYSQVEIPQPADRGILLRDILDSGTCWQEKSYTLDAHYYKTPGRYDPTKQCARSRLMAAEPINSLESGKARCLLAGYEKKSVSNILERNGDPNPHKQRFDSVAVPAIFQVPHGFNKGGVKYEKSPTLTANGDWQHNNFFIEYATPNHPNIYEVKGGLITVKGKQYPIRLADGFYIIRKLSVTECKRLQTVPDWFEFPVSNTQAYKMLGNGWTVEVIAHIMRHFTGLTAEPPDVLSMYDGMSCGQIALKNLGVTPARYRATEIDKFAIQTTQHNFPNTLQLGDAFQVRSGEWG